MNRKAIDHASEVALLLMEFDQMLRRWITEMKLQGVAGMPAVARVHDVERLLQHDADERAALLRLIDRPRKYLSRDDALRAVTGALRTGGVDDRNKQTVKNGGQAR